MTREFWWHTVIVIDLEGLVSYDGPESTELGSEWFDSCAAGWYHHTVVNFFMFYTRGLTP